ncbi:MAG: 2-(1,2-epoxy-1,2-dihydrophenyl)acetyl-CoA isomerase [Hyphomicrobiaceae bacterium]|jgi:2-(1,2-epoxy-1,2-dihydrophenyl)acetyl-CoA isomerase
MDYSNIRLEIDNGLARLTLARPKAANAIDLTTAAELADAAIRCDEDPQIRAVLITAEGKLFCAGGDVVSFGASLDELPSLLKRLTTDLHAAISRLMRGDAPVIVAVSGTAAGAGFSLAMAGDIVLAAESAKFTMAYTGIGLSPDGSSSWFLPRIIGTRRTAELMLTNRVLTATEAADWGLVTRTVPNDELATTAQGIARCLAEGPTKAYGTVKRLLAGSLQESLETQMEAEARGIAAMAATSDGRDGVQAFLDKRKPTFKGS